MVVVWRCNLKIERFDWPPLNDCDSLIPYGGRPAAHLNVRMESDITVVKTLVCAVAGKLSGDGELSGDVVQNYHFT